MAGDRPLEDDHNPGAYRGAWLVATAILVSGLLIFYWPWLSGQADFCYSDICYYFQPFSSFMAHEINQGRFPIWNPNMYCGMSQVAVPSPGPCYPFTWLHVLLPFSLGLAIYLAFHQALMAVGSYLLLRHLGRDQFSSSVGALIAALNGYMFGLSSNSTLPATIAWFPLAALCLLKIDQPTRSGWLAGAALCTGLIVLCGRPELGVPALILLGCIAVHPLMQLFIPTFSDSSPELPQPWSTSFCRLTAMICGLAIAAPAIVPALEWMRISPRAHGMDAQSVFIWSANWYDWLSLTLNQPMGDLSDLTNGLRDLVSSRKLYLPFLNSAYVGPVAITLAFWGLSDPKWRLWFVWLCLLFLFIMAACGSNTVLAPLALKLFPILATCRYPIKLIVLVDILLGLAAAYGTGLIITRRLSGSMLLRTATFWLLLAAIGIALLSIRELAEVVRLFPWNHNMHIDMKLMHEAQRRFGCETIIASGLGLAICGAVECFRRRWCNERLLTAALLGLVALPMILSAVQYARHTGSPDFFSRPCNLAQVLKSVRKSANPITERFLPLYCDPVSMPAKLKLDSDYNNSFFQYTRQVLLANQPGCFGVPSGFGYEAAETSDSKELYSAAYTRCTQNTRLSDKVPLDDEFIYRYCRLTAVRFVTTHIVRNLGARRVPMPVLPPNRFQLVHQNYMLNYRLYHVVDARPRVYVAEEVNDIATWSRFRKTFTDPQLAGALFGRAAWILPGDFEKIPQAAKSGGFSAACEIIRDTGELVEIHVQLDHDSLVVLSDNFYPGWHCQIDGAPATALCANSINRAVVVPAGTHTIIWKLVPESLYLGAAISAFTLIMLLLNMLVRRPESPRVPAPSVEDAGSTEEDQ